MDWTVAEVIRRQARAHPTHPAISYQGRTITYREMDARSSRVARGLVAEGVAPQERVAFLDKNGPEYFEILFGAAKANAVTVAVNCRLAPPEIEYTINDAEAKVLFVGSEFLPHLEAVEASLHTVEKIVVLGERSRHDSYEEWVARHPTEDPEREAAPADVALQLYTSGTTGRPKGAMLTNAGLGTSVTSSALAYGIDETAVTMTLLPVFHIAGVAWALTGMWFGGHTVLFRDFAPGEVLAAIPEHGVTDALLVPAMLQALCSWPGADQLRSSSLRSIVYGASPVTDEVLARSMATFGCGLTQVYGMTEGGAISVLRPEDHEAGGPRARLLRSAGRPLPWVEVRVVEPHTGEDRAVGEVGEAWVRSDQTMQGYWNQPGETASTITGDGWLKTGDAGFLDEEGYLFLTDRVKDMIVSGGENVYSTEVENVLSSHPDVTEVAVIGVPHERWGETVKALVVPRAGTPPDPRGIIKFARSRLAGFKCPTSIDFVDALPRNPTGKVLKRELREPYWNGHTRRIN